MFSGLFGCIWVVAMLVIVGYPLWRIFEKLGYPGVASLLMYIPIANLVVLWYAALNELPIEQELRRYRPSAAAVSPQL
jgi:hypothetical protein